MRRHSWNLEGEFAIDPPENFDEEYHAGLASLNNEDFLAAVDYELGGRTSYKECTALLASLKAAQAANRATE